MCGGGIEKVERRGEHMHRFGSSGGSIVSISPSPDAIHEHNTLSMRPGLHSGGSVIDPTMPAKDGLTPALLTPKYQMTSAPSPMPFFQFPINSITAYNPLTLPPVGQLPLAASSPGQILHGGKFIPFVPGIPGPNSLSAPKSDSKRNPSPNAAARSPSIPLPSLSPQLPKPPARNIPSITVRSGNDMDLDRKWRKNAFRKNGFTMSPNFLSSGGGGTTGSLSSPQKQPPPPPPPIIEAKKKFNFSRIADNLSPRDKNAVTIENVVEFRHFNFENSDLLSNNESQQQQQPSSIPRPSSQQMDMKQPLQPLVIDVTFASPENGPTTTSSNNSNESSGGESKRKTPPTSSSSKSSKFLRPSSLPLKPGTFTPKRHHGITPTANTLPLISPETPRPSKNCGQMYLNGHAYTYLGLKCSTKTFYCTVNRPQPVHFTNQHKLSIYSNWQICAESNPHPLGLTPKMAMSMYDSRQRPTKVSQAKIGQTCATLHSQSLIVTTVDQVNGVAAISTDPHQSQHLYSLNSSIAAAAAAAAAAAVSAGNAASEGVVGVVGGLLTIPAVPGGYESNADYTYIRGRGRGRYVCSECGIRCKKPSMLKKHIRTHTDVRPYTCQHCTFR